MTKPLLDIIKKTCPPDLFKMIETEGSFVKAAKAAGMGANTIASIAKGKLDVSPVVQRRIDAYHAKHGGPITADKPTLAEADEPPPVIIPKWDKKMETVKITKADGSKQTFKMPALIARLFERHDNVKNEVGRALGYSGWNTVNDQITKGKYEEKLHARAYCAVNNYPVPGVVSRSGGEMEIPDGFTLGIAICLVTLSEYERLEEIAEIFNGSLVFKMAAGVTGWIVIYRMSARDKLEKFKRLARRDAKRIVCP